jgi:hypothetical protein
MKYIAIALAVLTAVWCGFAIGLTQRPPVIVVYRVAAQPASYVVPVQECSRQCRAKAKSFATSQRFALKEGK